VDEQPLPVDALLSSIFFVEDELGGEAEGAVSGRDVSFFGSILTGGVCACAVFNSIFFFFIFLYDFVFTTVVVDAASTCTGCNFRFLGGTFLMTGEVET
jgi:hypothetical protein